MLRKARKAQQALEYLITYGWGFLVILIVIGALAYFGVLSPSRYLPESCDFGSQLQCYDYFLNASDSTDQGTVSIKFLNSFTEDIIITAISTIDGGAVKDLSPSLKIKKGEIGTVNLDLTGSEYTLVKGDKNLLYFNVSFKRTETSPQHYIIGSIYASSK